MTPIGSVRGREGPGNGVTGALALPWGYWAVGGLRGTPLDYRPAAVLVPDRQRQFTRCSASPPIAGEDEGGVTRSRVPCRSWSAEIPAQARPGRCDPDG